MLRKINAYTKDMGTRVKTKAWALGSTILDGVTMSADMKVSEQCGIAASKDNPIPGLFRRNMDVTPWILINITRFVMNVLVTKHQPLSRECQHHQTVITSYLHLMKYLSSQHHQSPRNETVKHYIGIPFSSFQ